MGRLLLAIMYVVLGVGALEAQRVRFFVNSEKITTDDILQLTVEVSEFSGGISAPSNWPNVNGFQAAGTQTSQSWVNGRMSASFSRTYFPKQEGKFTVPSFGYMVGGKAFNSPTFTIAVTKGTGKKAQPQNTNPFGRDPFSGFDNFFRDPFSNQPKEELKFQETKADYFLLIDLQKDSCYVGEQVLGEVVLYINERDRGKIHVDGIDIVDMQQRIKNTGFWQEIVEFDQVPMERVTLNGKNYIAYTLYRTILFPIKSGTIEFKGIDLGAKKLYVATNASPFDAFFGNDTKYEPIRIKAHERKLRVRPLPPTDLPSANMVGKFRMEASLSQEAANTGDNLELRIKLEGNGNIAMMSGPVTAFPPSFETGAPVTDYLSHIADNSFYGEKTFRYDLVPTRPGEYNLGPVRFYFFDPAKHRYDSLVVDSIPVRVTGEDLANKLMKNSGMDGFYSQSILHAKTNLRKDSGSPWLYWVLAVVVVGAAFGGKYAKRRFGSRTRG